MRASIGSIITIANFSIILYQTAPRLIAAMRLGKTDNNGAVLEPGLVEFAGAVLYSFTARATRLCT